MRHRKSKLLLSRSTQWRHATVESLSRSLLIHQSIHTTKLKAKAALPLVEKLITLGKKGDLASRRKSFSILQDHKLVKLLFSEITPRFSKRTGGYCRILPLGFRRGDGAKLVILELPEKLEKKAKVIKKDLSQPKSDETAPKTPVKPSVEPPIKKPKQKFLGGIRKLFKKEKNSL